MAQNQGNGYGGGFQPQGSDGWNDYSQGNWNGSNRDGRSFGRAARTGDAGLSAYLAKTYLWMFAGLMVTFVLAWTLANTGMVERMFETGGYGVLVGFTVAEIACVLLMTFLINKIPAAVAAVFFFAYAALTGATFSIYFVVFDVKTVMLVFGVTALFFGVMAACALIFKMQLDRLRPFLFGGLILLVAFGVLSFFMRFEGIDILISYIGIFIFLGYTAYDTTKIRDSYYSVSGDSATMAKASIYGALKLYLDFINLFLYILRIAGRVRN